MLARGWVGSCDSESLRLVFLKYLIESDIHTSPNGEFRKHNGANLGSDCDSVGKIVGKALKLGFPY